MKPKRRLSIFVFFITCAISFAQWTPINPGAGGQVQDIICDPNQPGRLFLASDMEGIYESTNHGNSWHIKGDLTHNRVYAMHMPKNDRNKVYVGTLYGLEVSSDQGKTFRFIEKTKKEPFASVAVSPKNKNLVIAGVGWRDDYGFPKRFNFSTNGQSFIYRSTNGGINWEKIVLGDTNNTDRNIFNIQFHPTKSNIVYIGGAKGIFISTDSGKTWSLLPKPQGTQKNRGLAISPNGKVIYAAYTTEGNNGYIYASSSDNINWQKVTSGNGEQIGHLDYWYPEVDERSNGNTHKILISLQGKRDGLFEGTFIWNQNNIQQYSWKKIWSGTQGYDNGWDNASPNPRFAHFTPKNWDRAIWSTTNQTIFQGKVNNNNYNWNNKYCIPNTNFEVSHWGRTWPTYSGRGTESTYTYDIAKHKNYVIQGQADNGFVESWDHGISWSNIKHRQNPSLSDVQAVDIGEASGTPIVVIQASPGYGGNANQGYLMAKKLNSLTPSDEWILLAGGSGNQGNLPNALMRDIAISPANKNKLFMFSTNNGMYHIENLGNAYNDVKNGGSANCIKISNGILNQVKSVKTIAPHPTNENIIFLNSTGGNQGVYKGIKQNGTWNWSKIYNGRGWDAELSTWNHNGKTYLFYSGITSEQGGDGNNFVGSISIDEGKTWQVIFNKEQAMNLRQNDWFPIIQDDFSFINKGGVIGYKDKIIMSYYHQKVLYINGMKQTGYFWQLLGICELLFGILLLLQKPAFIGAIFLLPITLHIFLFHAFLESDEIGELIQTAIWLIINIVLVLKEYSSWRHLLWIRI